jgi:predicted DCC family thiol-disulfide oxidoreductase YuxK
MKIKEYLKLTKTHITFDAICEFCNTVERITIKLDEKIPICKTCKK